jgi:geranyl-CoA carboxylase alpha subunit
MRITRTLKAMGIEACAVYSTADASAPHVRVADRSFCIGEPAATDSYLCQAKVLQAAKHMECDAVHPGYGFLSENASFAQACRDAGLVFIGPSAESITAMGDKAEARRLAQAAGISPVPGFDKSNDDQELLKAGKQIGTPLLVKASKGGGGKGMRVVTEMAHLKEAIDAARREAKAAFGDPSVLLERRVFPARHIEVQLLSDQHGNVAFLWERECSLQRRHQKVIEECPSSAVSPEVRERLAEAAIALARAVKYEGAGTIEFLMEEDGTCWFLEMNTRLQVEHGVTEMVLGEDLVEWQVRVAQGEKLDERLLHPQPVGHAIEARIYAEDPDRGFLPASGMIYELRLPEGPGIRVDSGVRQGQEVTPHYDPMLMKVMAFGRDREQARERLELALAELTILGPATNHGWLLEILNTPFFRESQTFTHTLEDQAPATAPKLLDEILVLYAAASTAAGNLGAKGRGQSETRLPDAFLELGPFRIVHGEPE